MSHWRIDNPCFGHAPFQSFTPRFPLSIYTTCSCLMSKPAESLASHFLCCSMCLSECGELLLKDRGVHNSCLNVKAGPTHGDCVIYTCCITWCSVLTDSIAVPQDAERDSVYYKSYLGIQEVLLSVHAMLHNLTAFFLLLSCQRLQASLPLLHLWSDLQPRGGVHHYFKCLLTTGIRHNRQLGLKERAANGLV